MKGSCLCKAVSYEVDPPLSLFQYCHCSRCQTLSGSSHRANIYVAPNQFRWLSGEDSVQRYEIEEAKYFANQFCKHCGSSLPWLVKGGRTIVLPAGSLDEDPGLKPSQNVFWADRACWFEDPDALPKHAGVPAKA